MSRRRRKDSLFDFLPQIVGMAALIAVMVPWLSKRLICILCALFGLVIVVIIKRIANSDSETTTLSYNSNGHALDVSESSPQTAPIPSLREKLHQIDWYQFEKLLGIFYRSKGYFVHRLGGAQPDGGVDLIIEREGVKTVVQCKHWKSWTVGVRNIREFLGTLTDQQIPQGIYVTLKGYTNDALQLAHKHNITLLDEPELIEQLEILNWRFNPEILSLLNDTRKLCPKCESEMVLRTATKGSNRGNQFWGCSTYPRCHYILKIS